MQLGKIDGGGGGGGGEGSSIHDIYKIASRHCLLILVRVCLNYLSC
jgi:hypothetical protein